MGRIHPAPLVVALTLLATGCLGDSRETVSPVHATGRIVTVGGPAPGSPAPIAGAEFRLVGSNHAVDVRAGEDGRFVLDVPPGRYRVVITGHAPASDGGWLPTIPSEVIVASGRTRPLRLVVPIR
jgi:hypothetical protein